MNHCNDASWTEGLFWSALCSWNKVERCFIFNVLLYFEGLFFLPHCALDPCTVWRNGSSLTARFPAFSSSANAFVLLRLAETRRGASQRLIVRRALIV